MKNIPYIISLSDLNEMLYADNRLYGSFTMKKEIISDYIIKNNQSKTRMLVFDKEGIYVKFLVSYISSVYNDYEMIRIFGYAPIIENDFDFELDFRLIFPKLNYDSQEEFKLIQKQRILIYNNDAKIKKFIDLCLAQDHYTYLASGYVLFEYEYIKDFLNS